MASKLIGCIAAAGLVLASCATPPPTGPGTTSTMGAGFGARPFVTYDCRTDPCDIEIKQGGPFWMLSFPDQIDVYVPRPMTIRWKLKAWKWTKFNPAGGINFANRGFSCAPDSVDPLLFTCKNDAPTSPDKHKYGIATKGFGSPPDIDPWVVNR